MKHLQERGGITSAEAFKLYGITRLSGRIYELRRDGYKVVGYKQAGINRDGEKVFFDRYMLMGNLYESRETE